MEEMKESRRSFIVKSLLIGNAIVGLLLSIPVIGALIAPLVKDDKRLWRKIGPVDKFQIGKTVLVSYKDASQYSWSGTTAQTAAWLRRVSEDEFIAYSVNCTHLGCPVRWINDAQLFLCPCHGGVYNKDGSNASGPPRLPLPKYPVRVRNNQVEIETSPIPITTLEEETA